MNAYQFDEIRIGATESFQLTITSEMMDHFCELTGDVNPLHCDDNYAKAQGYPGRVVYGMLTASFISTLGGIYLPGKYCLIQSVECKFLKPVHIGDTLTVRGTVAELHESVQQAEIKVEIKNQTGVKVAKGLLKVGFLHP